MAARDVKSNEEMSLHPWIAKMKDLDNWHITQWKQVAEAVEEAMKSNKKPFTVSSCYASTSNADTRTQAPQQTASSGSTCDYSPKLTKDEHQLLMDHAGCYKCQKFYAGYCAHQCLATTSGKNYETLTVHNAQHAKASQSSRTATMSQLKTIATVSDANSSNQTDNFIATIFSSLSLNVVGNGSFSEGSDNSLASVTQLPHIKSKHFIWNYSLTGPAVDFPVTKPSLIDNSCHMVLIWPDVVEQLGLPIFSLDQPEEVDVAISFSKAGITHEKCSLVHYVKICPFSSDSVFHSWLILAVVCLGLCMPFIFGLPFLELNDVVCDHKRWLCIVQHKNFNYNFLDPVKRQELCPPKLRLKDQLLRNKAYKSDTLQELLTIFPMKWKDRLLPNIAEPQINFISLILHWIKTLEIEASMSTMENNLRKTFAKVFQPIPHMDKLPMAPLAWITWKDAKKVIKTGITHVQGSGKMCGMSCYSNT